MEENIRVPAPNRQLQLQNFPTHQALPFHVTSYVREEIPTRLELETHIDAIYISS